jgi:hypothetical protein
MPRKPRARLILFHYPRSSFATARFRRACRLLQCCCCCRWVSRVGLGPGGAPSVHATNYNSDPWRLCRTTPSLSVRVGSRSASGKRTREPTSCPQAQNWDHLNLWENVSLGAVHSERILSDNHHHWQSAAKLMASTSTWARLI